MKKRDIGEELLRGLEEIAAWQKGQQTLQTTELKRPTAGDVVRIRKRGGPERWVTTLSGLAVLSSITTEKIAVEKSKTTEFP